ncbi:diguanylate cyclase [Spongiibacter taiwanensis]|uniref:sensor domain-containing diguanylate cyclase n=1 Tax=Spongiibacter taiwanensis TaxID=1748242 RepID=UPI002035DE25|nr:sensor domain-containing diguanylate cyclase [Spongiibacter taiwanensis]USA44474.1 diguanylate cyclase [Spongiibacter taiwanensis]
MRMPADGNISEAVTKALSDMDELSSSHNLLCSNLAAMTDEFAAFVCPTPVILTTENLRILYMNAAAEVIFGKRNVGAVRSLRSENLISYVISNTAAFIEWVNEEPDTGFELVLLARNFTRFLVFVKSRYVDDRKLYAFSFVPSSVFMSDSVTSQACQTVFQYARVAIYITDESRHIIATNPAFDELFEMPGAHLVGKPDELLYEEAGGSAVLEKALSTVDERRFWKGRIKAVKANGTDFMANLHVLSTPGAIGVGGAAYLFMLEDVQEQVDIENSLRQAAETDSLTGLSNRAGFGKYFEQVFSEAMRKGESLTILFFDLDGFKTVNDRYGHPMGDKLLSLVAKRLRSNLKQSDFIARMGGDEFVIVMQSDSEKAAATAVASKVLEKLAAAYFIDGVEIRCTASIGIATYPNDGTSADLILEAADSAMYRSKECRGNTFTFCSDF